MNISVPVEVVDSGLSDSNIDVYFLFLYVCFSVPNYDDVVTHFVSFFSVK